MAGDYADRYLSELVLPHYQRILKLPAADAEAIRTQLCEAVPCLQVFFGHYAFARRGKDRDDLSSASSSAINRVFGSGDHSTVLGASDGAILWESFAAICEERGKRPNEPQNRGLLQGLLELAQEIYAEDKVGSIAAWIVDTVEESGRIEDIFNRVVDIRGVGPKSTSTFLRDILQIFDCEQAVEAADRIYIQPVDRWLRAIAPFVVPEPNMDQAADWIVAGKISKYTRRAGVSGSRFNMGCTYFGQRLVKDPARFPEEIKALADAEVRAATLPS